MKGVEYIKRDRYEVPELAVRPTCQEHEFQFATHTDVVVDLDKPGNNLNEAGYKVIYICQHCAKERRRDIGNTSRVQALVIKEPPQYRHNCPRCEYVGRGWYNWTWYQLYWCDQGLGAPVINVRLSNEPEDIMTALLDGPHAEGTRQTFGNDHPIVVGYDMVRRRP